MLVAGLMKTSQVSHDWELYLFCLILKIHKAWCSRRIWTQSLCDEEVFMICSGCSQQPAAGFQTQGSCYRLDKASTQVTYKWVVFDHTNNCFTNTLKHLNASLHPYNLRCLKGYTCVSTHNLISEIGLIIMQVIYLSHLKEWTEWKTRKFNKRMGSKNSIKISSLRTLLYFRSWCSIPFNYEEI